MPKTELKPTIVTVTDFKINAKKVLDELDSGKKLFVTRGSKVYEVVRSQ